MLFNSIEFAIFLPLVFLLYWFPLSKNLRLQNFFMLCSSYIFYGWWDYRFLGLIVISSCIDYLIGIYLHKQTDPIKRKSLLIVSLVVNLSFLGFFKYYNFFVDSFIDMFTFFGYPFSLDRLRIILPIGISFYTFQTLSYSIDIYQRKIEPTKDWIAFFAFVSFFPQLVAGPIERAKNLLPQFTVKRTFNYHLAIDGARQILWGFFKKIVIADTCAEYVNIIFQDFQNYSSLTLIMGAVLFALQIYGDFSGYSDIAIGTSKLFGIKLLTNFSYPYFSRDIAEFWRRWHISLSTWFRDYVYISLGGSRVNTLKQIRNIFIVFLLSGLWHGANWTFVFWGGLNAIYYVPLLLSGKNRTNLTLIAQDRIAPSIVEIGQIIGTFTLTCLAWIFFRSENLSNAFQYIFQIARFENSHNYLLELFKLGNGYNVILFAFYIVIFFVFEWKGRAHHHPINIIQNKSPLIRYSVYFFMIISSLFSYNFHSIQEFIYFQF